MSDTPQDRYDPEVVIQEAAMALVRRGYDREEILETVTHAVEWEQGEMAAEAGELGS